MAVMKAKIAVDLNAPGPEINPMIFGHFIENLGRCIYQGGLLARNGTPREEIVQALEEMRISVLRWPGGLFADGYHWQNGVGPHRPVQPNVYWKKLGPWLGPKDPNLFGTHEFLALCGRLRAQPYININLATGRPQEAAEWVQYCNGGPGTPMGKRRTENGRTAPWGVKIWGLGNEIFGWWALGHSDAPTYAHRYLAFCDAMTAEDPTIKPVAVGACDLWPTWNPALLSRIGDKAAYLSVHVYLPGNSPRYLFLRMAHTASNHYALCSAHVELGRKLRFVEQQIKDTLGPDSTLRIALDEWNLWWWWPHAYKVWWTMRDAVAVAGMAGVLVEHCEDLSLANLAQAVNVLGLLHTTYDRVVKTPLYYVMKMFASTLCGRVAGCNVDVPAYSSRRLGGIPQAEGVPFVSAYASADRGRFGMVVVQRRYEGPVRIEVHAPNVSFEKVQILSAPRPEARNTFKDPDRVSVTEWAPKDGKGGTVLDAPAASVIALTGSRKSG